jgi:hypothetical protein
MIESQMDDRIREGIEACRPASDDLAAQDLADVARALAGDAQARAIFERSQRWDTAIGMAVEQVSVPAGLAERILSRLQAEAAGGSPSGTAPLLENAVAAARDAATQGSPVAEEAPAPARPRANWSRRDWAGATASLVAAALVVVMVGYWLSGSSDISPDVLAEEWEEQLDARQWQTAAAPEGFAIPDSVVGKPARWQWIDRISKSPVVAYELVHAGGEKARLFVARVTRPGLSNQPPAKPQFSTGGRTVAHWQSGPNLCVLVAASEASYRRFVRPSSAPLAMRKRSSAARAAA